MGVYDGFKGDFHAFLFGISQLIGNIFIYNIFGIFCFGVNHNIVGKANSFVY